MSNKITKLLNLAFANSNPGEATSAFSKAVKLAIADGKQVRDYIDLPASNDDRESELVSKYNTLLGRAKELRQEVDTLSSQNAQQVAIIIAQAEEIEQLKKAQTLYQDHIRGNVSDILNSELDKDNPIKRAFKFFTT